MSALWIILGFLALVMYGAGTAAARERELLNAERMAAIEKGLFLPSGVEPFPEARSKATNALGSGLLLLGGGLGLGSTLRVVYPDEPVWAWGICITAVGLAQLAYWFLRGKSEWEEARQFDREMRQAWASGRRHQTSLPGGPPVE